MSSDARGTAEFPETALPPEREADLVRLVEQAVGSRLPPSWAIGRTDRRGDDGVDGGFTIRSPDGQALAVLVQAKRLVSTRDIPFLLDRLAEAARQRTRGGGETLPLIAARYLAPTARERIAELGGGYVDATGNVLVRAERPALFLRDRGADTDPWRGPGRPRGTLQGTPAARVVRALIDFRPPYTTPELAERAKASLGATYRVVELAEAEGLLERRRRGPITDVRWRALLERWSQDYGFARSNATTTFLEPRGLEALTARLATTSDLDYVVTGSLAAAHLAPYAPARLAMVYVRDLASAAEALRLRPAATGGNVALAAAGSDVVFERAERRDGVLVAAPSQVAVDLLTGPGRSPAEAGALLDWMEANEPTWRR